MFGLWEERKKAWNVSLLLRNEECVHVCLHKRLCAYNYTCEVGSSRAQPTFLGSSIINCGGTIISVYFDPTTIRGVTD